MVLSVLFICLVFFVKSFLFIFLRPVSCVANVASVPGLFILHCLWIVHSSLSLLFSLTFIVNKIVKGMQSLKLIGFFLY